MSRPLALVVTGPGTNRDVEAARALDAAGADVEIVRSAQLLAEPQRLDAARIVLLAGGFSHADALGAGRMLALELTRGGGGRFGDALQEFVASGRPVIGICNGFQVLTRAGLLPGALGHNAHGTFECRWVELVAPPSRCIWTNGIDAPIECPIAHGEGRFVHPDTDGLVATGQVALRYASGNPNGSTAAIAGVCDPSGVVLGLMPHPEDHISVRQHPRFRRGGGGADRVGLHLFAAGVRHAKER